MPNAPTSARRARPIIRGALMVFSPFVAFAALAFAFWPNPSGHHLYALDVATGRIVWFAPAPAPYPADWVDRRGAVMGAAGDTLFLWCQPPANHDSAATLTALDATTGRTRWEWQLRHGWRPGINQSGAFGWERDDTRSVQGYETRFVFAADAVYVFLYLRLRRQDVVAGGLVQESDPAYLVRIDDHTGRERWGVLIPEMGAYWKVSLSASADTVALMYDTITGGLAEQAAVIVRAFDAQNGELRWHQSVTGYATFVCRIHGQQLLISYEEISRAACVAAYDLASGTQRWKETGIDAGRDIQGRLVGDTLVIAGAMFMVGLDAATGSERWRYPLDENLIEFDERILGVSAGTMYIIQPGEAYIDTLIAIDAATGHERWRQTHRDIYLSSTVGDYLITYLYDGDATQVASLAEVNGAPRWHFPLVKDVPTFVAHDQHVFVICKASRWRDWLAWISAEWRA